MTRPDGRAANDGDVRHAKTFASHPDAYFNTCPEVLGFEPHLNRDRCLNVAMTDFSHVALQQNPFEIFAVRFIGAPEVFGQRNENAGSHVLILPKPKQASEGTHSRGVNRSIPTAIDGGKYLPLNPISNRQQQIRQSSALCTGPSSKCRRFV